MPNKLYFIATYIAEMPAFISRLTVVSHEAKKKHVHMSASLHDHYSACGLLTCVAIAELLNL